MAAGVAFDLGVLAVFKYYAFFVADVGDVLDTVGLGMPLPLLTIALPVGVSFFSFQAVTYVVDTYRGQTEPASLLDAAIYLSFFPHLVAGPIVRASEFLPQLKAPRNPNRVAAGGAGLTLVALGLVKKLMIADYLAREVVDPVFAVPQAYGAADAFLAAYGYAAQIYCDFSGYTDMAIGLALLMGFVFPQNFDSPYRATGFRDFWRRWHMTLTPLPARLPLHPAGRQPQGPDPHLRQPDGDDDARRPLARRLLNFVLWGAFHGTGLAAEHRLNGRLGWLPGWFRWLVVFNLVVFGWILFRTQDLDQFADFVSALFTAGEATPGAGRSCSRSPS